MVFFSEKEICPNFDYILTALAITSCVYASMLHMNEFTKLLLDCFPIFLSHYSVSGKYIYRHLWIEQHKKYYYLLFPLSPKYALFDSSTSDYKVWIKAVAQLQDLLQKCSPPCALPTICSSHFVFERHPVSEDTQIFQVQEKDAMFAVLTTTKQNPGDIIFKVSVIYVFLVLFFLGSESLEQSTETVHYVTI